jgi:hypothetical protein
MNMLLETLRDPLWQVLGAIIVLAAPFLVIAVRTRDVRASEQQKHRETRSVLLVCLAVLLLMSGWVAGEHLPHAAPSRVSALPTPAPAPTQPPAPLTTPTPAPTPTPTPRLARSITQVLVTFCEAINHQDYQTAWNEYARSLQHKHLQPDVVAAWRRFIHCSIPDQSADPSAIDTLTLTLGSGYTDRFGRSGDINYRFTMGIEQQAWRITGVCEIYSEGCFDLTWG